MDYDALAEKFFEIIVVSSRLPYQKEPLAFSRGEMGILGYLVSHSEGASPGMLCENLGIGSGRTADALKSLESKGLIARRANTHDGRRVSVFITDEGKTLVFAKRSDILERLKETLLLLGDEDAKEFIRLLSKINSLHGI